jgi:phosphoserine phosphatase
LPILPILLQVRQAGEAMRVDVNLVAVENRRKRLLLADMDSTIITDESLDEMAALAGLGEAVAAITARSMNGELDFEAGA